MPADTSVFDQYEKCKRFLPQEALAPEDYATLLAGHAEGRQTAALVRWLESKGVRVSESAVARWRSRL